MIVSHVHLPPPFFALRGFPGYFWNEQDNGVYSIKSGVLKKIKISKPFRNKYISIETPSYRLSVNGKRKTLMPERIKDRIITDHVVEVLK